MVKGLKFTRTHEWVEFLTEDSIRIGLTDYAVNELGDLVFVNLPEVDDEVEVGESFADVESVKAVSNVYSPVTGTIRAVNEELFDHPEIVNDEPYNTWFIEIENIHHVGELLLKEEYEAMIIEED